MTWYQSRLDSKRVCNKQSYTYFFFEAHHPRKAAVSLMATTTGASTKLTPAPTQQIIVHQDNSTFPTGITLDKTNYGLNSWRCVLALATKLDISSEKRKKLESRDPNLGAWITENHRVKSWLIDSMSLSLMQRFIRLSTAKKIWEAVSKTFYDRSDETCTFELN